MRGIQEWLKANGGFPAVVVVGVGLAIAYWPLGLAVIAIGLFGWLYTWPRFPLTIGRRYSEISSGARRELLGLTQAVTTELETCRYRLAEAKSNQIGWLPDRQLPAETYNLRWTPSVLTADEVTVNDALRAFYVWADELNGKLAARAAAEAKAIGLEFHGQGRDLDADDLRELDEGLRRVANAQSHLQSLTSRLTNVEAHNFLVAHPGTALGLGLILGFAIGFTAFDWQPWQHRPHNRFVGFTCEQREGLLSTIKTDEGPRALTKATQEKFEAEHIEPCDYARE